MSRPALPLPNSSGWNTEEDETEYSINWQRDDAGDALRIMKNYVTRDSLITQCD